jgi:hypothetical protein
MDKLITWSDSIKHIVACRPISGQRPRDKQICNSRCWVTASQASVFAQQQLETETEERYFLCGSCQDLISRTVSSESSIAVVEAGKVREPRVKGSSASGNRYRTTAREDWEDFMCAVVTVNFGVCNSVRLSSLYVATFCKCSNPITNPNPVSGHSKFVTRC